jgi:hypothetical protein
MQGQALAHLTRSAHSGGGHPWHGGARPLGPRTRCWLFPCMPPSSVTPAMHTAGRHEWPGAAPALLNYGASCTFAGLARLEQSLSRARGQGARVCEVQPPHVMWHAAVVTYCTSTQPPMTLLQPRRARPRSPLGMLLSLTATYRVHLACCCLPFPLLMHRPTPQMRVPFTYL